MPKIESDHDLLITLNTKVDALTLAVKELRDGTSLKIAEQESRIRKIEELIDQTNPAQSYKDFLVLKQEVHDFKVTAGVWRFIAGSIGAIVFYVLTQLPHWIKLLWSS